MHFWSSGQSKRNERLIERITKHPDNLERADRILDAAAKLIVHYGYDKTTVSDIAREAGVSKGAVYLHWESKDALFEALIYRESERVVEDLLARIDADPEAGTVFSLYQYSLLAIVNNPLLHAVMTQDIRIMGDFARRWVKADGNQAADAHFMRQELVKQLQAANVIRADLDAEVVAHILAVIRYGMLTIHEIIPDDETPPLETVGKTLGLMLEQALAPEGGPNREAGKAVLEHLLGLLRQWVQGLQEKVTRNED